MFPERELPPEPKQSWASGVIYEEVDIPELGGRRRLILSTEAAQDTVFRLGGFSEGSRSFWEMMHDPMLSAPIRTPEPTEDEVREWRYYDDLFSKLDVDAAKRYYGVRILEPEVPYQEPEW